MTGMEANREIVRLAKAGHSYEEVAAMLHSAGYVSPKTGRALTVSAVNQRACKLGFFKRKKRKPKAPSKAAAAGKARGGPKIDAIKSILKIKGMAAEERIALALQVLA